MTLEKENKCTIEDYGFEDIEKLFQMLSGKWKIQIIYHLSGNLNIRYGELKRKIPNITHKVLTAQLKELERNKIISRTEYFEKMLRVEYNLTQFGLSLLPVYEALSKWCMVNSHLMTIK